MKTDAASNDNREAMGFLPAPVSESLFNLGWRHANELFIAATSVRPTPTMNELVLWVAGARQEMNVSAVQRLQSFCEFRVSEDLRWLAKRIAQEGFDTFLGVLP